MKKAVLIMAVLMFAGLSLAQNQSTTVSGPTTDIELEVMETEPVPLQAGQYADIWIRATNVGNNKADSPVFKVEGNFPFTPTDRDRWEPTGGLDTGDSYDMRVQVRVDENAVFGENDLKIRTSATGQNFIERKIPLEVRVDDRSLIVSDLEFPERLEPGSSADMNMTLENLANSDFRNIDVMLDTTELPISTRETSRQRVPSLGVENEEQVSFTIDADDDADIELYDLPIEFNYQDQAGNELSMTETTGVNIGGFPNLDVKIEESDIRTAGSGQVTFRIVNMGEGQARFTEIELQESDQYEILSEDSIYIGSMIDDDFQTAEFNLYVEEDELLELPVEVRYRDGKGDQTEEFNVERTLYTGSELRQYGLSGSGTPWILIVGLGALVIAGIYYWRRRRE